MAQKRRIKNINKSLINWRMNREMITNLNFSFLFLLSACGGMGNNKKQGILCCRTPERLKNWKHQEPLKACREGKESYRVRLKARLVESL